MMLKSGLGCFFICVNFCLFAVASYAETVNIALVEGDAKVLLRQKTDWIKAYDGMTLSEGDRLKTDKGSRCILTFGKENKNFMVVLENSDVLLLLKEDEKIELIDAEIYVKLLSLPKGTRFEAKTPTAVCGARGTSFGVKANKILTKAKAYENSMYVINKIGEEKSIEEGFERTINDEGLISDQNIIGVDDSDKFNQWSKEVDIMMFLLETGDTKLLDIKIINAERESQIILGNTSAAQLTYKIITEKEFRLTPLIKKYCSLSQEEIWPEEAGLVKKVRIEFAEKDVKEGTGRIKYITVILSKRAIVEVFERKKELEDGRVRVEIKLKIRPIYETKVYVIEGKVYVYNLVTGEELLLEEGESITVIDKNGNGYKPPDPPPDGTEDEHEDGQ